MYMKKPNKKAEQITLNNEELREFSHMSQEQILDAFQVSMSGYTSEQAAQIREEVGMNEISTSSKYNMLRSLYESFANPFTFVLLALASVSLFTDVILAAPNERNYISVSIVLMMVLISGTLSFLQESKSNKAAEQLKALVKNTIEVQRKDQERQEIPMNEIVPGDLFYLMAGDMIPADSRILHSKDLFISQSALTGESDAVEKEGMIREGDVVNTPLDARNLVFMGSNVISGTAVAIALKTGDATQLGNVAQTMNTKKKDSSFDVGVHDVSMLLIRFMLVMAPTVLVINGITKGNWIEAILFGLSVAVGLTPEMLPMVVSTNLAKGAMALTKKKAIVKNLPSIQNFGAIDILCTDKTGTITQDKVILEMHLDVMGHEDERVLRHAFLNSFYQTGLRNLMDIAILDHDEEKGFLELQTKYHKIDEIPFDFDRRCMSVVIEDESGKRQMITKGAVEEMLANATFVEYEGKVEPLTQALKHKVRTTVNELNEQGLRVIAIAQKNLMHHDVNTFSIKDETEMVLMGYLAFYDPPKVDTSKAIEALHQHGLEVKVLTGDNEKVTKYVCGKVGLPVHHILLGHEIEAMSDSELKKEVELTTVFAKLSPFQKIRVVEALRSNHHVVGFMGDGINDAGAMKVADIGISVDTAVDIAKEAADIILLEKDLLVLSKAIEEGRKTFVNILKYIQITISSNFGNMFSVLIASAFLPFLPMLPIQILLLNLIYDFSCVSMPWDHVDMEDIQKPKQWNSKQIKKFMLFFGPISSIFDITTYIVMFFVICPLVIGGPWSTLDPSQQQAFIMLFHAGWFVESLCTQTFVIYMLRTQQVPFLQSRPSTLLFLVTFLGIGIGIFLPFSPFASSMGFSALPILYFGFLFFTLLGYVIIVNLVKYFYVKRYGALL